jgi:hypothetical protein
VELGSALAREIGGAFIPVDVTSEEGVNVTLDEAEGLYGAEWRNDPSGRCHPHGAALTSKVNDEHVYFHRG